ncbi:MAG: PilZ domain-containing protein [Candidatus Eremiobacterota bacterium]
MLRRLFGARLETLEQVREKRKNPRLPCHVPVQVELGPQRSSGVCVNMGGGGMALEVSQELDAQAGDYLTVTCLGRNRRVTGHVVWKNHHRVGVRLPGQNRLFREVREQRAYVRVPMNRPAELAPEDPVELLDLSLRGARIRSRRRFQAGTQVWLRIQGEELAVAARVLEATGTGPDYQLRLQFPTLAPAEQTRLAGLLVHEMGRR